MSSLTWNLPASRTPPCGRYNFACNRICVVGHGCKFDTLEVD